MASKEENESSVSPSICSSVQDENNNANNQPLSRRRTNSRNTSNPSNPAIPQPPHAHGISPQQARPNMNRPPSMLYII